MFIKLFVFACALLSVNAATAEDRLNLKHYPSTYLNECDGIAYIYKANRTLMLGIRSVKHCSRIRIGDNIHKMERYGLGFRYETEISRKHDVHVSVGSRKRQLKDRFVIEPRSRDTHTGYYDRNERDYHDTQNTQSLVALRHCSKSFDFPSVREYCHEKMRDAKLDAKSIIAFCSKAAGSSNQKRCLDDSLSFHYEPVATMSVCSHEFPSSSARHKCIDAAKKYHSPPTKIIKECTNIYPQNAKRLRCIEQFSTMKYPEKKIDLLAQCADKFFASKVDQCYQTVSKVKRRASQTLDACANNFPQPSNKLQCLTLSTRIKGTKGDDIVQQCTRSHIQTRKQLSCIEKFTI